MEEHNYVLIQVDFWDAWFVRRDLADAHLGLPVYYDALSWFVAGFANVDYRARFINTTAYGAPFSNGRSTPYLRWTDLVRDAAVQENRPLTKEERGGKHARGAVRSRPNSDAKDSREHNPSIQKLATSKLIAP